MHHKTAQEVTKYFSSSSYTNMELVIIINQNAKKIKNFFLLRSFRSEDIVIYSGLEF